jgi:23S rRNA maturation-related 3'-5' exoribonuclease YhaM
MVAAVVSVRNNTSKNGEYSYVDLRAKDGTTHKSVHWDGAVDPEVAADGNIVYVEGTIDNYKGEQQIKIKKITLAQGENALEFLPTVPRDEHKANLKIVGDCVENIVSPNLKAFAKFCIKGWWKLFSESTSAMKNHHALRHGYVKHVSEMILITDRLIEEYIGLYVADSDTGEFTWRHPRTMELLSKQEARTIDADLVRATVPLHDWGKLEQYATTGATFTVTKWGKLLDHPGITPWRLAELRRDFHDGLQRESSESDDTDKIDRTLACIIEDDLFAEMLHVIGAHHGKLEYNACSPPKTVAAMILHVADYASCFLDVAAESAYQVGEWGRGDFTDKRHPNPDGWQNLMRS